MQYFKPYTYFISKPGSGSKNLLWGFLCYFSSGFIPIVGPLVWMGYIVECIRSLKQDPQIEDHPDFDVNKFTAYLSLGIWPLVMNLILGLGFFFVALLIVAFGFAVGYAFKEPLIGIAAFVLLYFPCALAFTMLVWPMTLHSQIRGALELGAAFKFTMRFFKLVGGQALISLVIHFLLANCLVILGLLLCIVGMYASIAIITMAQEHYMVQLYRLYLDEGGEPISESEEEPKLLEVPKPRKKPDVVDEELENEGGFPADAR